MNPNCLYHEDKVRFDRIQKELQKSKWIRRNYVHRLAMAVCSCRKKANYLPSTEEFEQHQSFLYEVLTRDSERGFYQQYSSLLKGFILDLLNVANVTQYSQCKLMAVLCKALHKDYSLLERSAISSNEPIITDEYKERMKKNPIKLTAGQLEIIKKKKKKKMLLNCLKLPLFPGNIPKLESAIGETLFEYSRKTHCYLEWDRTKNDGCMQRNENATFIKVWSENPVAFNNVKDTLIEKAKEAQQIMDRERRKRQEYKKQKREWKHQEIVSEEYEEKVLKGKDVLADDFAKKSWKTSKNRCRQSLTAPSVLESGRCLNCLKPFTTLKDRTVCNYHPGYIVGRQWNCCGEPCKDSHATFDQHLTTGCTPLNEHVWRTHAKADRRTHDDIGRNKKRTVKHRYTRQSVSN